MTNAFRSLGPALTLLLALVFAACGQAGLPDAPATSVSGAPTLEPTAATPASAQPTATAVAAEVTAVGSEEATAGVTAEGRYFLGDADAPVTIVDYSDFL